MQFANNFNKNLLLTIPYITTSNKLFKTQCLKKVELKKIGLYLYIQVEYSPCSTKQHGWLMLNLYKENNITNIYDSEETKIIALYKVPSNCEAVVNTISTSNINEMTSGIILDNIKFWKESAFLLFE